MIIFFFIRRHLTLSDNSSVQFYCLFLSSFHCSHLSKTFNIDWIFDNDQSCFMIGTDDVTVLVKKFAKSLCLPQTCAELYFSATSLATCAVWLMKHLFEARFIDANNFDFSLENVTRDVHVMLISRIPSMQNSVHRCMEIWLSSLFIEMINDSVRIDLHLHYSIQ